METIQACIYPCIQESHWSFNSFPGIHPLALPLAGKGLQSHLLDLCTCIRQIGITDVLIADCHDAEKTLLSRDTGHYWSLNVRQQHCSQYASPGELLEEMHGHFTSRDILLFWGAILPDVQKTKQLFENLCPIEHPLEPQPDGLYLFLDGTLFACECPLHRIQSLQDYIELNFKLLENPGIYTLPGYSPQGQICWGKGCHVHRSCRILSSAIIGDGCRIERGVTLQNQVIVGNDVFIGENAVLDHCIVLPHTIIPPNMAVRGLLPATPDGISVGRM